MMQLYKNENENIKGWFTRASLFWKSVNIIITNSFEKHIYQYSFSSFYSEDSFFLNCAEPVLKLFNKGLNSALQTFFFFF